MRKFSIMLAAVTLLLAASFRPAGAQNCADPQSQMEMNICAAQDLDAADKSLNVTYRALMNKVSPAGQSSLRAAEKAWLNYRDKECAFETAGTVDGSVNGMMVAVCETALTEAQTARLNAQLHCEEGNLSCGGQ